MNAKLLIAADLGLLKAYTLDSTLEGSPHLEVVEVVALALAHHRLVDEVTDRAGRRANPSNRCWAAPLADDHHIQLETRRRLVKELAGHIQRLARNHPERGLLLAAEKEINRAILEALPAAARRRIETNLARNLVKAEKADLVEWFAPGRAG